MNIAFMFSGQGSQYMGMGRELYDKYQVARHTFEEANDVLGFDITDIIFNNSDKLNETPITQPALLTTSVAYLNVLRQFGVDANYVCGLSLGEYTAYVASGVIEFRDAVELVHKRGKYMAHAVPDGTCLMCAIIGLKRDLVLDIVEACNDFGFVAGANFNSPIQTVIAGEKDAVLKAADMAKTRGAKFVTLLNTSGPFHTKMLEPVVDKLLTELNKITINKMNIPVVSNVTGEIVKTESEIIPLLASQVMKPVLWEESINTLISNNVDTFVEIGAGKILASFVRQINRSLKVMTVESVSGLEAAVEFIGGIV